MATVEYWEKRQETLFTSQDKDQNRLNKKMTKEYNKSAAKIEKEVASYYTKYSQDDVLQYRTMVQQLSEEERTLLYQNYDEFANKYPQYKHLMPVRESIYKLNRLEGMQLSVRQNLLELGGIEQAEFEKTLQQAYSKGYLSSMKGLDNASTFFGVDNNIMRQVLSEKWTSGGNYSDRIWQNKERLIDTMNNELRDGMIRGDSYAKITKQIYERTSVGEFNARRLVATESAFVMNSANKQAFMDAGIERYQITAVLDSKTSPTCKGLDGEWFYFSDAKVGVNYPPFHAFCRTTVIPIENDVVLQGELQVTQITD